MRERPILFSAPMVRAILAGTKTQTRRVVKGAPADWAPQPPQTYWPTVIRRGVEEPGNQEFGAGNEDGQDWITCPYGQPGDRLWVRESHWWFKDEPDHSCGYYPPKLTAEDVEYRADGDDGRKVWRPSIHMPRWASRITLEIAGVRVERLQEISDADAEREGTPCYVCGGKLNGLSEADCHCFHRKAAAGDFRDLWESINGSGSWYVNPWVWVVEFKQIAASQAAKTETNE